MVSLHYVRLKSTESHAETESDRNFPLVTRVLPRHIRPSRDPKIDTPGEDEPVRHWRELPHVPATPWPMSTSRPRVVLDHSKRLVAAQRVSSLRLDSCSLRSTLEACDSTVFTEMNRRDPISR